MDSHQAISPNSTFQKDPIKKGDTNLHLLKNIV